MGYSLLITYHLIAIGIFLIGIFSKIYIWFSGKDDFLTLLKTFKGTFRKDFMIIVKIFIIYAIFQKKLYEISRFRWFSHIFIFFSTTLLLIPITIGFLFFGIDPAEFFIRGGIITESLGVILLIGILIAGLRRVVSKNGIKTDLEDGITVVLLFSIAFTGFLLEGWRFSSFDTSSYLGSIFGAFVFQKFNYNLVFQIHSILGSTLIAYIPFTKLIHIFSTPITNAWTAYREIKEYGGSV